METSPSRRTKAKGKPGIYYRETPAGRRYEVTYLDSDGRRRWQTVAGHDNLDEADATLVAIKSKLNKGERVAPSKSTFTEVSQAWYDQLAVAERTKERYEQNLRLHLRPRFGRRRIQDVTKHDVGRLIADLQVAGYAGWTIRNVLTTLSGLMAWAEWEGIVSVNPVRQVPSKQRPKVRKHRGRTLQPSEITALLTSATTTRYRMLLATAIFSGLRLMELLALRWQDVDFDGREVRVRVQLRRKGGLAEVKSESGVREVALRPELATMLKEHRMASLFKRPEDFVFASATGGPLGWRNVERRAMDAAFEGAVEAKRLPAGRRKPVMHDCRHTFGSMLIAEGRDVYSVKRQMGHANASTTLDVYTAEFGKARDADQPKPNYGNLLETAARNGAKSRAVEMASTSGVSG